MTSVDHLENQTIVEVLLYILREAGGLDCLRAFAILYCAERSFMARFGMRMTQEEYRALDCGSVPYRLYEAVMGVGGDAGLRQLVEEALDCQAVGALRYLRAKRCADLSFLSPVMREVLDDTARECRGERLVQLSHDEDWKRARTRTDRTIDPLDIAKVGGASAATLELLREELAWDAQWCPGRS